MVTKPFIRSTGSTRKVKIPKCEESDGVFRNTSKNWKIYIFTSFLMIFRVFQVFLDTKKPRKNTKIFKNEVKIEIFQYFWVFSKTLSKYAHFGIFTFPQLPVDLAWKLILHHALSMNFDSNFTIFFVKLRASSQDRS